MYSASESDSGGSAVVHWLEKMPSGQLDERARQIVQDMDAADTAVLVTGAGSNYVAESYAADGDPIQFCGHGALAAAWFVLNELAVGTSSIHFNNRRHSWTARLVDGVESDVALSYASPEPVDCLVPEFAQTCLGVQPDAAAEVGGPDDYLILELADLQMVRSLQPDFAAIVMASRRAIIVTARALEEGKPGCVFRYFAPQYGSPEDAATGSAAVQLAAYWRARLGIEQFPARQLSPQGARMQLGCDGFVVELAARVRYG